MNKFGIQVLCFLIPFALHLSFQLFMSAFRSGGDGGSFDRFGMSWIVLKSVYFGTLGLLIGLSARQTDGPASLNIFVYCCYLVIVTTWAATGNILLPGQDMNRLGTSVNPLALKKTLLIEAPKSVLGEITDIVVEDHSGTTIAGRHGAIVLGADGNIASTVAFGNVADMSIVRSPGKHNYEFLNRGAWGVPSSLLDMTGRTLWTYDNDGGIDDTTYGDVDGDGHVEFVVGMNGDSGVTLLDQHGKKIWNKPDSNVFQVAVTDPDETGRCQIVHTGNSFTVRDFTGKIISEVGVPGLYCCSFSLCHWPGKTAKQCVIACADGYLWLVTLDGTVLKKLKVPEDGRLDRAYGVSIRLRTGEPDYLAVLIANGNHMANRALLRIYDPAGEVIYSEVLPEDCSALAVEPAQASKPEKLLLGARSKVWRYENDR